MDIHARGRCGGDADALHRPGDVMTIRRNGDGVERSNAVEVIEHRVVALLRLRVSEGRGEEKKFESDAAHGREGYRFLFIAAHGVSAASIDSLTSTRRSRSMSGCTLSSSGHTLSSTR
jgi:hypothetical protein